MFSSFVFHSQSLYIFVIARLMSVMCTVLQIMCRHAPYCWLATSLFWYWARISFLSALCIQWVTESNQISLLSHIMHTSVLMVKFLGTSRAVVKSTFVESKTSPSPGLSSPSQDRVQRGSSLSQDRVQRGSSPSQVQMRQSKQRNKKRIFFKTTYLIIDNLCDTRDSISSNLI